MYLEIKNCNFVRQNNESTMKSIIQLTACILLGIAVSCSSKSDFVEVQNATHYADTCNESLDTMLYKQFVNIIRDSIAMDSIFGNRCASLPEVEFDIEDLIAAYAEGNGCMVEFSPSLFRNRGNDVLTYHIGIKEYDTCKVVHSTWNLMVVPKLRADETINIRRTPLP